MLIGRGVNVLVPRQVDALTQEILQPRGRESMVSQGRADQSCLAVEGDFNIRFPLVPPSRRLAGVCPIFVVGCYSAGIYTLFLVLTV